MPASPKDNYLKAFQTILQYETQHEQQLANIKKMRDALTDEAIKKILETHNIDENQRDTLATSLTENIEKFFLQYQTLLDNNPLKAWKNTYGELNEQNLPEAVNAFFEIIPTLSNTIQDPLSTIVNQYDQMTFWLNQPIYPAPKPSGWDAFVLWLSGKNPIPPPTPKQIIKAINKSKDKKNKFLSHNPNFSLGELCVAPITQCTRYKATFEEHQKQFDAIDCGGSTIQAKQKATNALTTINEFLQSINWSKRLSETYQKFARLLQLSHAHSSSEWHQYAYKGKPLPKHKNSMKALRAALNPVVRRWVVNEEPCEEQLSAIIEGAHSQASKHKKICDDLLTIKTAEQLPAYPNSCSTVNYPNDLDAAKNITQQFLIFQAFLPLQRYIRNKDSFSHTWRGERLEKIKLAKALLEKRNTLYTLSPPVREQNIRKAGGLYNYLCQEIRTTIQDKVLNEGAHHATLKDKLFCGDFARALNSTCAQLTLIDPEQRPKKYARTHLLHDVKEDILHSHHKDKRHLALIANGLRITQYYLKTFYGRTFSLIDSEGNQLPADTRTRHWERIAQTLSDKLETIYLEYHNSLKTDDDRYRCYLEALTALDGAVLSFEINAHKGATRSPLYHILKHMQTKGPCEDYKINRPDFPSDLLQGKHWNAKDCQKSIDHFFLAKATEPFQAYLDKRKLKSFFAEHVPSLFTNFKHKKDIAEKVINTITPYEKRTKQQLETNKTVETPQRKNDESIADFLQQKLDLYSYRFSDRLKTRRLNPDAQQKNSIASTILKTGEFKTAVDTADHYIASIRQRETAP